MKPQRYVQRVVWAENARQLGLRWRSYMVLIAGAACFTVLFALWPHMPLRELLIGLVIGATTATLLITFLRADDPQVRGDWAEQWTAEAFGKLKGWRVTNGLTFTDGDVDHLVIAPSGVLAVETKYRYRQPDKRRLAAQRHGDLAAAARAARKATSLIRSKSVGHDARVTPVLMVWGKGRPELPDGYVEVNGTFVLDGDNPRLWSHLFSAPLLPRESRDGLHSSLAKFQGRQVEWAARRNKPMRAVLWAELRAGATEAKEGRRTLRDKRRALHRRHAARSETVSAAGSVASGP